MTSGERDAPASGAETLLCLNCAAPYAQRSDFCPKCGAPVGQFTTLDPLKSVYAQGQLWRQAAGGAPQRDSQGRLRPGRPRPLALLGIWLIFGLPALAALAGAALGTIPGGQPADRLTTALAAAVAALITWRATANYLKHRKLPPAGGP